jgi:molecular chaperone DnaJ
MAATGRDYYEVLGVGHTATEADIKRAFRRLARELHPDVSAAPDADERFKEIVEAYEVLSKSETRELYDRFGHAGLRSGGFRPTPFDFGSLADIFSAFFGDDVFGGATGPRRARGADIAAEIEIELEEAAAGVTREVPVQVAIRCAECGGDGVQPGTAVSSCEECGGTGRIQQVTRTALGEFVRAHPCGRCRGTGRIVEHPCETCSGAGRTLEERSLEVEVPPGIHDGQRIRLSGEGHAGALGGQAGDVYVLVRIRPHERLVREGDDVYSTVDLTMTEAALGARATISTLEGEEELDFEAGTQPGSMRVLRGRGMPVLQGFGRGDHRVLINVVVPRHLTEEQRRMLGEFERTASEETYKGDEGFFEKLKSAFR